MAAAKRAVKPHEVADAIIAKGRADNGNLVAFQQQAEIHETPALKAAGEALQALDPVSPKPMSAQDQQDYRDKVVQLTAPKPKPPEDPVKVRYARAAEVEMRLEAGEMVSHDDQEWFELYRTCAEYRAQKRIASYNKKYMNG
ncbi:MAG: hypothetical protein HQL95_04525 [Magnetococcales bacterium]|nr:hypothetical protein [Magnetococcales bacterium]